MIDIFSLLKKKQNKKSAGQIAKERLKLVLIHDRSDCSAELLENIRKDIMDVLSKYMEIDMDALDIQISTTKLDDTSDVEVPALYANIPIKNLKITPRSGAKKSEDKKDEDKKETKKEEKKDDKDLAEKAKKKAENASETSGSKSAKKAEPKEDKKEEVKEDKKDEE